MALADVLASHRSGDKLCTPARTLVAVRQAWCLWVLWPRRAKRELGHYTSRRLALCAYASFDDGAEEGTIDLMLEVTDGIE
ncbi:hypothetical protein ABZT02_34985 [Streptomyces sp. NPDC005402]|uniref:hypothetical protein n=1 Tax=Streptomyces sp. NPDC005402 TaxID=3155338 RepID=UPI0033A78023